MLPLLVKRKYFTLVSKVPNIAEAADYISYHYK